MIKGKKVNLRVIDEEDIGEYIELWSNLHNRGDYYSQRIITEISFKEKFFENGCWEENEGELIIENKQNEFIGNIYFRNTISYFDGFEVGYIIFSPLNRGKGYAKEALFLFTDYLFQAKPINRLYLRIMPGHTASKKVAEHCGFIYEGTARKAVFMFGEYQDFEWYSVLREEIK